MAQRTVLSSQTQAVLVALAEAPGEWRHGYDLSRVTGLKSGTLYPILMRLESQRWLEAMWEEEPAPGKPRRHLYRLTAAGAAKARELEPTLQAASMPLRTPMRKEAQP